jgi:YVTN family beta-propeller protein
MGRLTVTSRKRICSIACFAAWCVGVASLAAHQLSTATAAEAPNSVNALELETKIALGNIHGRIDHLAFDPGRQRLYVAELGNDSVGVVDLKTSQIIRTLPGFRSPQGIAYVRSTDTVYVASAGDGSVRLFQGENLTAIGQIALGNDADNVRVDEAAHRVFVGYGDGAIAVIDTANQHKIADVPLHAHPESFQLEHTGARIFVNVPDAHEITSVDRLTNKPVSTWPTRHLRANFAMAMDEPHQRIVIVFRHAAKVAAFRAQDGRLLFTANTCEDADDVFIDDQRNRVYVSCGEGVIDVLAAQGGSYISIDRVPTAPGARTSLFIPSIDRFALAVRATGATPAAIWVFRPVSP